MLIIALEILIFYGNINAGFYQTYFYSPGCSITVVRMHGVHVARVQFPAPRHHKKQLSKPTKLIQSGL